MRLKKLKLSGFKSFCDSTELEFIDKGITLIVGPNGCGKSNVVDAIRWVLGEQSPSYLRGHAMGDVIFAGSDARKPVGRSEVTILFDNSDGLGPEKYREYSEISVTRRLYRSGESEYLINKTPCRLMDIRELVMDTGIAGRSYSIIEQGRAEQFITASPAERRIFMEEAAGVVRYKTKRIAAEKKLEQTTTNLLRVQDMLGELQRQETQLRGQKEKAAKYRDLRTEVEALTARLARARFREAERRTRELEASRHTQAQANSAEENTLAALEAEAARLDLDQTQREAQLQAEREALFGEEREIHEEETRLALERQNRTNNAEWVGQVSQGISELVNRRTALGEQSTTTREGLELLRRQELALRGEVEQMQERHLAGETARAETEAEMHGLRERLLECHTQLTGIANQRQFLQERLDEGAQRTLGLEQQLVEHTGELELLEKALEDNRARVTALTQAAAQAQDEAFSLVEAISLKAEELAHKRSLSADVERNTVECESRLASLREIEAGREDFDEKVRTLLDWAEQNQEAVGELGWMGPLADYLNLPEDAPRGAAEFLASYLELIVVSNASHLPALQGLLEAAGLGGARLVALDAFPPASPSPSGAPTLAGLVDLPTEFDALNQGLFGRVMLHPAGVLPFPLPDTGDGVSELLAGNGAFHVDPKKVVTLGRRAENGSGLFRRRAEIAGLAARLEELSRHREEVKTQVNTLSAENERLLTRRAELEIVRERETLVLSQKEQEVAHADRERQRLELAAENLRIAAQRLATERDTFLQQQIAQAEQEEKWESERATLQEQIQGAGVRSAQTAREASELARQFTEKKVEYQRVVSREEHFAARLAQLEQEQAELEERAGNSEKDLSQQRDAGIMIGQKIVALTESLEARQKQYALHQEAIKELARAYDEQEDQHRAAAKRVGEQRQTLEKSQARLHEVELALATERTRLAQLTETLAAAGGEHALANVEEMEPRDQKALEANLAAAQQRLGKMEGINLAAAEEYDALTTRLEFLGTQKADLETAINNLKESIRHMNQESRRRFKETFDLVNEKFQKVFPMVFNGGTARLVLTDEEDLLLAGVEIEAQPPGKKLQNLTLLSGGEKSLTAIALIFSFFLIKPSPFCLLDEVDAPLDDVNVKRFTQMVQNMTDHSQFIIITHNKRTMEIGDLLYGVTMEEAGVSKVVSVNLSA